MDRGTWQVTVHRVAESDPTEMIYHAHNLSFFLSLSLSLSPYPLPPSFRLFPSLSFFHLGAISFFFPL